MRRFFFLFAMLTGMLAAPRPAYGWLHAGELATDFHKTDLDGNAQTLFQYRGKVVVLFVLGYS